MLENGVSSASAISRNRSVLRERLNLSHLVTTGIKSFPEVAVNRAKDRSSREGVRRMSSNNNTPINAVEPETYALVRFVHAFTTCTGALAKPYPGKSAKTNFSSTRKKLIPWVLPGVDEVLARALRPSKKLIREDFPTFDLPANAISGKGLSGSSSKSCRLVKYLAV